MNISSEVRFPPIDFISCVNSREILVMVNILARMDKIFYISGKEGGKVCFGMIFCHFPYLLTYLLCSFGQYQVISNTLEQKRFFDILTKITEPIQNRSMENNAVL
jgi:hypothetical protein